MLYYIYTNRNGSAAKESLSAVNELPRYEFERDPGGDRRGDDRRGERRPGDRRDGDERSPLRGDRRPGDRRDPE